MQIGADQNFFGAQTTTYGGMELSLSTGGPHPGPNDGDGRQSSHWKDDSLTSTRQFIGIMDPTMPRGLHRTISENDMLALDLFGYSIGGPAIVRPPNDNFANAIALTTGSGTVSGTNVNATRELGESAHVGLLGDKSIWYSWTSAVNGQATFDTIGSNFDTTLSVYLGTSVNQLNQVAANDDILTGSNKQSRVQFNIIAGQTYRIVIDGWNSESGSVKPGKIVDGDGVEVNYPVRLDGSVKPLHQEFKVTTTRRAPVARPVPAGAVVDVFVDNSNPTNNAVFLSYQRCHGMDFSLLGI
jgi:hypothetical protein